MNRQLYRPKNNRVIAGVCAGFAEYFNIDVTIVRIISVVIALSGTGVLAYIIAAIIMPDEKNAYQQPPEWKTEEQRSTEDFIRDQDEAGNEWRKPAPASNEKNRLIFGVILVGLGVIFIFKQFFPGFDMKFLVPLLLIGIGGVIIFKGR